MCRVALFRPVWMYVCGWGGEGEKVNIGCLAERETC
jgi:hypothetical protein